MVEDARVLPGPARRQVTIGLMVATAMQAADATIANVGLPHLEASFGGGIGLGAWVMTSYLCAAAVTAPLTGWLYRRHGARALFVGSVCIFGLASLLCAAAPSATSLVLFRVLQGAAGGILQPLAQAVLLDIHPRHDHARMQGLWGATLMLGPVLGPILGGIITDLVSWRAIFLINLPVGAIAIWGLRRLPPAEPAQPERPVDWIGIVLVTMTVGALELALQRSIGSATRHSTELILELGTGGCAAAGLAIRSLRARFSLFSFEAFQDGNYALANLYNFVISAQLFVTIVLLPALAEGPLGYDAARAGLIVAPRAIAMLGTMYLTGHLMSRVDPRLLLAVGLAVAAGALLLITEVPPASAAVWLVTATALQGLGAGIVITATSTVAFAGLSPTQRGDAAGLYILLRQLGGAFGVAAMSALLEARIASHSAASHVARAVSSGAAAAAQRHAVWLGYQDCFQVMALATILIVPGLLLLRYQRQPAPETA